MFKKANSKVHWMGNVEVIKLGENKRNEFIKLPFRLYKPEDRWIPPFINEQKKYVFNGNYSETGIIQPFLAYKDNKLAGRIIAHYNKQYNLETGEKSGLIGFFESLNDCKVSNALFKKAEEWLKLQGMESMKGPLNFLIYTPSGVLIKGFDTEPSLELSYNHPYYQNLFEEFGFQKSSDWHAYEFNAENKIPECFKRIKKYVQEKKEFTFRNADMKNYGSEIKKIREVFNKAWKENQEHFDLSEKEFSYLADSLKAVIKPELAILAEKDKDLAGFIVSFPDISNGIKKANGHLFPFGFYHILNDLKNTKKIKTMLMGILPEYRKRGLDAYLILETIERAKRMGYKKADLSLIVDSNIPMKNDLEKLGAKIRRTYRIYKKEF